MREQLETRLQTLLAEQEKGQARLQELDRDRSALSATLLRISGAIQVLQEELADPQAMSELSTSIDGQLNTNSSDGHMVASSSAMGASAPMG